MNKKLITLAVAAAMVAPLAAVAETTLYGRIDVSLNTSDIDGVQFTDGTATDLGQLEDGWDMQNETTRIGVKGSEALGNGLKAIFQAEWAFEGVEGGSYATNSTSSESVFRNRLAYAGLSGGWGTVAMGRQWTPYYGAVNKADIYNKGDINPQYLGTTRTGNALSYITPNWSGFSAAAVLTFDNANNVNNADKNKGVDTWQIAGNYDNGPLSVGLAYNKTNGSGINNDPTSRFADTKIFGIGASYTFQEMFKIIGQYEDGERPVDSMNNKIDIGEWTIAGEAYWGNNIFRASYADYRKDLKDLDNIWAIGWQYNFSKRTRVYAEYFNGTAPAGDSLNAMNQVVLDAKDGDVFGFGVRHDF